MSIDAELKDVRKKLDDIEKKQDMMNKMYQLDGEKKIKRGEVPSGHYTCLLYTSPSPRDGLLSRMPSSA